MLKSMLSVSQAFAVEVIKSICIDAEAKWVSKCQIPYVRIDTLENLVEHKILEKKKMSGVWYYKVSDV